KAKTKALLAGEPCFCFCFCSFFSFIPWWATRWLSEVGGEGRAGVLSAMDGAKQGPQERLLPSPARPSPPATPTHPTHPTNPTTRGSAVRRHPSQPPANKKPGRSRAFRGPPDELIRRPRDAPAARLPSGG